MTGGPRNKGTESDGPAALAEPALADVVRAAPTPVAGTTVWVKPFPCNLGSLMRMSLGALDITLKRRTAAQARGVQRGAARGGAESQTAAEHVTEVDMYVHDYHVGVALSEHGIDPLTLGMYDPITTKAIFARTCHAKVSQHLIPCTCDASWLLHWVPLSSLFYSR